MRDIDNRLISANLVFHPCVLKVRQCFDRAQHLQVETAKFKRNRATRVYSQRPSGHVAFRPYRTQPKLHATD